MTWLQYAPRHVHETIASYVEDRLEALNWMDPDGTPFGSQALTVVRQPVVSGDGLEKGVTAGTVAVTLGDEFAPDLLELGGPLSEQEIPVFVDVFMSSAGEALAVASDVRDILLGRLDGCRRVIPVVNQIDGTEVEGWRIEFDLVERTHPGQRLALHWQVVRARARVTYPEVMWG